MKSWIQSGLILAMGMSLLGCDPIKGTLNVVKSFTVKAGKANNCTGDVYPCDGGETMVNVAPGSYAMKMFMNGRRSAQIQLKVGRQNLDVYMDVPRGKSLPDNGRFTLTSRESGQPFDLDSNIKTSVRESEVMRDHEQCQISYQEPVCGIVPGNPPRQECHYETRIRIGFREVEFFYRDTHQDMNVTLNAAGSANAVAHFTGQRQFSERIYTYQGMCF